jgi:hypothetical protein
MSFETLKIAELKKIAEDFAVDVDGLKSKNDVIAALADEGVTWVVYSKTLEKQEEDEEEDSLPKIDTKKVVDKEDSVLVKMTRANFRYDILGFTFTREHPFVAMADSDAQAIFDKEEGFRLATPKEVQEFYS